MVMVEVRFSVSMFLMSNNHPTVNLTQPHTCQPDRSQMTEIFPIDNARALTWNGRRACTATAPSLTAVAHLDITLVSPILSQCVTNRRHSVKMLLPIHEQV